MLIKCLSFLMFFHSIVITTITGRRSFQFEFTNVSTMSYDNSIEINSSISSNGAISIYINTLQDLPNLYVKAVILLESSIGNYDLELANTTVDSCEFFRNRKYEPILQVLYKSLTKTGTFPRSCPIWKKLYYIKDVVIDPEDFPPAFPNHKGYVDLTAMYMNGNKKKPLFEINLYVQCIRT